MHPARSGSSQWVALRAVLSVAIALVAIYAVWFVSTMPTAAGESTPPLGTALETVTNTTPLEITSFTASPTSILPYQLVFFNLSAQGGTPPYSYSYQDLPPGCTTANVSSLQCHPHSAQHYIIEGTVNDSAQGQVNATANLTITSGFGPPPEIKSFVASPSPASVGRAMYFAVDAISESATPTALLGYAFLGLPPGCATFNQTNLSCVPSEPGKFQVWVRVTDSFAQFNQTYLFLNVTGTGPVTNSGGSSISSMT
ncbi:MAG: hypothetical protein L3J92_06530, partial [Thermoplasmata archaeon]|nr:hypothetical protein [Thermoplasmata archaeon]